RAVGLERIRVWHLNDSVRECASRVDRHAAIGLGRLGMPPFRFLVNDSRFAQLPMILETPKGTRDGEELDAINLRTLRGLLATSPPPSPAAESGRTDCLEISECAVAPCPIPSRTMAWPLPRLLPRRFGQTLTCLSTGS